MRRTGRGAEGIVVTPDVGSVVTYLSATLLLLGTVIVAGLIPARRAIRIDLTDTLRGE